MDAPSKKEDRHCTDDPITTRLLQDLGNNELAGGSFTFIPSLPTAYRQHACVICKGAICDRTARLTQALYSTLEIVPKVFWIADRFNGTPDHMADQTNSGNGQ